MEDHANGGRKLSDGTVGSSDESFARDRQPAAGPDAIAGARSMSESYPRAKSPKHRAIAEAAAPAAEAARTIWGELAVMRFGPTLHLLSAERLRQRRRGLPDDPGQGRDD
jgi:hypothetical protein